MCCDCCCEKQTFIFEVVIQREYACPENELQNENENNKPDNKQVLGGKYCCLGIVICENIGASETAFLPHNSFDKITRKHKLSVYLELSAEERR